MNCIIVDDEYPSREEIKYFINKNSHIDVIGEFDDSLKVLKYLQGNNPDVIFLDINMPGISGIELAGIINKFDKKPIVVFITAYGEYAPNAFQLEAFDYILKPFSEERINETIERLVKVKIENPVKSYGINDRIAVKKNEIITMVDIGDICYCKSYKKQTIICTENSEYTLSCCISNLLEKLPQQVFFMCHRCYIVNGEKIEQIIPWFNNTFLIKIKGADEKIPVSRNRINEFKHFMHL
jgi:two-component system LytT family response regulator